MESNRVEGTLKEAEGKPTGDAFREQEGNVQDGVGTAKDTAGDAWDKTEETASEWKDKIGDKVNEMTSKDSDPDGASNRPTT